MDKNLSRAFKKLPDTEVPLKLHLDTYRGAIFDKYQKYAGIAIWVMAASFLFSIWHTYTRMIETDTIGTAKALWGVFEFDLDSFTYSIKTIIEFVPLQSVMLSGLNLLALLLAAFTARKFSKFQGRLNLEHY